uniref:Uncharacterized protein n=1 Tax=Chlamydomonas chlamydogama TaxID=225041 RepID=A0A7S2QTG6_9CHLO|mmetsp:Transcript_1802/g.4009  ORF Transcript_1802/g.4009 Transcript_1802/m.4009 type:complete len:230 (+) Transcript_1802:125-814(+)
MLPVMVKEEGGALPLKGRAEQSETSYSSSCKRQKKEAGTPSPKVASSSKDGPALAVPPGMTEDSAASALELLEVLLGSDSTLSDKDIEDYLVCCAKIKSTSDDPSTAITDPVLTLDLCYNGLGDRAANGATDGPPNNTPLGTAESCQRAIQDYVRGHGGADTCLSGVNFNFTSAASLSTCLDGLRNQMPWTRPLNYPPVPGRQPSIGRAAMTIKVTATQYDGIIMSGCF